MWGKKYMQKHWQSYCACDEVGTQEQIKRRGSDTHPRVSVEPSEMLNPESEANGIEQPYKPKPTQIV